MKIGIITQPLNANYGGLLQNYALQQVLKRLGHDPITIDYRYKMPLWFWVLCTMKSMLFCFIPGKRRRFLPLPKIKPRKDLIAQFVDAYINLTNEVSEYKKELLKRYQLNGLIVGSDQVWRPIINKYCLYDCYLGFAKGEDLVKVAYAASFGVDSWEYSSKQTKRCKDLIRQFSAISVREQSGIALCERYLGCKAIEVLDPTLLLSAQDYSYICKDVPQHDEPFLAAYILDMDEDKRKAVELYASFLHLPVLYVTAGNNLSLSVSEWLALFRDASFVVTDSFHGTVFSIINHKDFVSLDNKGRGSSRFESLLSKLDLNSRFVGKNENIKHLPPVDWIHVDERKTEWINLSIEFLKKSLRAK